MDLLVLCTANQCRSPMVVGLLEHGLTSRGITDVDVTSAGFLSEGRPATEDAVLVMKQRGLDISSHRSRTVDAGMLLRADLVLGLARQHVREATVLAPRTFGKLFTLKELVRRGEATDARQPGEPLADWLARLGADRPLTYHLGDARDDDVADPVGKSLRTYKRTAKELDDLVERFFDLAWSDPRD